ncbi:PREDICTED: Y+L amino acid transporter 2-like [Branchiostoma belcheri]|uniref:Y+L amino acid transporter 2-like n=1 Tax=Branchiostoma belcheri TaxID=7741 RepID=A0A6P4Z4L7_BRABE|nr:PREDICTED: Y+L amino acid transporter 2-like [Branchiostoma belcheri]
MGAGGQGDSTAASPMMDPGSINHAVQDNRNGGKGSPVRLQRQVTLANAVGLMVGNILGSGIFIAPKGVLLYTGSTGLSLIVWAVSGVFSALGALCYAELGTSILKSGASYAYILEAFGPFPAFLRLWVSVLIVDPTGQAVIALTFSSYLVQPFFPGCEVPYGAVRLLAIAIVCVLTFVNCANVRWVTRVQDAFAYAGVAACVMVIISGVVNVVITGDMHVFQNPFKGTNPDMGRAALALYPGLYAFAGWDMLNFITEEIKNPHKNLPRAIWISMPIVTVLYILINLAMYSVLSAQQVLESEAVAVTYAEKAMGVVSWTIPILVAMTTIGGINAYILAVSRLYFVGSREGHLPQVLSMINIWTLTPAPAVLFNGFLVCCYLISDDVLTLINYFSFMYWIGVGLSIAALLYLRWRQPDMHRPIKVHLALPVLFLMASLFLVIVPFYSAFRDSVIGCAIFLSGVPVYYIGVHRKVHPAWLHNIADGITRRVQKLLLCVPQEAEDTVLQNDEERQETEKMA